MEFFILAEKGVLALNLALAFRYFPSIFFYNECLVNLKKQFDDDDGWSSGILQCVVW